MRPSSLSSALATASLAASLLAGCLPASAPIAAPAASPPFEPEAFFAGRTEGRGTLVVRGGAPREVRVQSVGATEPDGTFRLDQTIAIGDRPARTRTWRMRRQRDGRYTSTLTDATGDVDADVRGNTLRIRYRMGRGATMDQTLTLRPDGRTADNVATVRVLGVPWARLAETITRLGPGR